jgi:ribosomal protein S18 acetylase RimI-like enzyme
MAQKSDLSDWMDLMWLVIDGYPVMNEMDHLNEITKCIEEQRALFLKAENLLIGGMAFSYLEGSIEFLGVHPQYRNQGIQKVFLDALLEDYLQGKEISMTTYLEGDKADTGHRDILKRMGFAERELLTEFGYPTQRFVLPLKKTEDTAK